MDRGTYTSASGGFLQFRKLEVVNNNLANINTPGFKRQVLVGDIQTFDQTLASLVAQNDPYAKGDHDRSPGTINVRSATDFSPGPISNTGNVLDVALRNPNDFFVVNTPEGIQYTRAGNFILSESGEIVMPDGMAVQGDGGPIPANGPGLSISPSGAVIVNGAEVGKFQVVRFEDPSVLQRSGGSRFALAPGAAQPEAVLAEVVPGALEMSNVTAISSIVDLMTANRAFEMYTRTAQTIDQLNATAVSQVGRSRGV